MRFLAPRIRTSIPSPRKPTLRRTLYSRQAEFITSDPQGSLVTRKVAVDLGDAHEAYAMLPTEIGHAFRDGIFSNGALSPPRDPELCPLTFYHDTRHFAH
ncbi:hypothetical protein MMC16_000219, partial [Acarospora aff. strigata]|nr:hypothetical protein [Acarospora aff. strigata]